MHPLARALRVVPVAIALLYAGAACTPTEVAAYRTAVETDTLHRVAATRTPGAPSDQVLENLRACESHGNYGAVSGSGTYRGAYQFSRRTWDNVAGTVLPRYLGHDPATAPPHVQDGMARALWSMAGPRQWPVCGPRAT